MKKVMMLGMTGLILFAASAAGSWFLMRQQTAPDQTVAENETTPAANHAPTGSDRPSTSPSEPDRLAFQPDDVSVETLMRVVESMKTRQQALTDREQLVRQREERLKLVRDDLQREKKEIEELNISIENQFGTIQELVTQLESQPARSATVPGDADNKGDGGTPGARTELNPRSLKRAAEMLKGLPEDKAADTFKYYVNSGKMDLAIRILEQMEQRDASKIIAAFEDDALRNEILDAMLDNENGN